VWIAIVIYTILFSLVEIRLYDSFKVFTWDLGIFNQAFWNTLHGRFFFYTTEFVYTNTGCFLGTHFSPFLIVIVPLYGIYPTGETLLVISTIAVALGALVTYKIASFLLDDEKLATIIGVLYLLYPALQGITLSGFSPESFMGTFFLLIIYYLIRVDLKKLALVVTLGLMTHEASIPVIAFIAIYGLLYHKSIKNKGFQLSLVILMVCIPYFFFAKSMKLYFGWTGQTSLWREWALVGATSTSDLPLRIILNPIGAVNALFFDGATKLLYIVLIFLPVLFVPLLSLRGLIPSIPYLFISLFSSYGLYYSLTGHYAAFVAPFVFIAFIEGIKKIREKSIKKISPPKLMKMALLTSLVILSSLLPLTYSQFQVFKIDEEHNNIIRRYISYIPRDASILTQSNIFPHIANRPDAYTIPPPTWGDQYTQVGRETLVNLSISGVEYVLLDFKSEQSYTSAAELIYSGFILKNGHSYKCMGSEDGVMLFKAIYENSRQKKPKVNVSGFLCEYSTDLRSSGKLSENYV
jgi:uncharacterized membrane protein